MTTDLPRVLVTRAAEDAGALSHAISELGLQPVEAPAIHRVWNIDAVAELAARTPEADWVVVTSGTVAEVIATAAPNAWPNARYAAVGPSTAARLDSLGLPVHVVPGRHTAAELVRALGDLSGQTVVWPHGDLAPRSTFEGLASHGAHVEACEAYRNVEPDTFAHRLLAALPVDGTTLLSGSAARRIAARVPTEERWKLGRIIVIGPSTRAVAEAEGFEVHAMAQPHTLNGMLYALQAVFSR